MWPKSTNWKNLLSTLVALVLYACIIDKVGYLLTTFFFMLFLFRVVEPQKWIAATLGAVTTALLSYLIFEVWLQTQLPNGVLFAWLKKVL